MIQSLWIVIFLWHLNGWKSCHKISIFTISYQFVSIPPVCLVLLEVRRGPQVSKNWSYRWLWVSLWVPGIELWSSIRTTLVLNGWSISPAGVLSNLYLNAQWGRLLINSKQSKLSLNTEPKSTMWRGPSPHFDLFQAHKYWDCANEQPSSSFIVHCFALMTFAHHFLHEWVSWRCPSDVLLNEGD